MHEAFLIWSIDHDAWWRSNWLGYTSRLHEAGRYPREDAERILRHANVTSVHECMIPVAAVAADGDTVSWGDTREKAD